MVSLVQSAVERTVAAQKDAAVGAQAISEEAELAFPAECWKAAAEEEEHDARSTRKQRRSKEKLNAGRKVQFRIRALLLAKNKDWGTCHCSAHG